MKNFICIFLLNLGVNAQAPSSLKGYFYSYMQIAQSVGVDLSHVYKHPINISFKKLPDGVLGIAKGMYNDSIIDVQINSRTWNNLDVMGKYELLYHELSHDILNAEHKSVKGHIMHPRNLYKDMTSLVIGVRYALIEYKYRKK